MYHRKKSSILRVRVRTHAKNQKPKIMDQKIHIPFVQKKLKNDKKILRLIFLIIRLCIFFALFFSGFVVLNNTTTTTWRNTRLVATRPSFFLKAFYHEKRKRLHVSRVIEDAIK